jgi:hypothetical protein
MSHSRFLRHVLDKLRQPSSAGIKIDSSWLNTAGLQGTPGVKGDPGIQGPQGVPGVPGPMPNLDSPGPIGLGRPDLGHFTELIGYRPIVKVSGVKDLKLDDRGTYQWCVDESEIIVPTELQVQFYRGDEIVVRRHTRNSVVINGANVSLEGINGDPIGTSFRVDQSVLLKKIDTDRWIVEPIAIRGVDGIQGPQGLTGAQGLTGLQGPIGLTGPQGIPGTSGGTATPSQRYEYTTPITIPRLAVPATAKTVRIKIKGGGGGSGSGARGAIGANCSGGSSGSSGNESSSEFDLAEIAVLYGFVRSDFWIEPILGAAGTSGAAVTTNDTDGVNGSSGGTSYVRFQNGTKSINKLAMQAGGGNLGLGGRRGGNTTSGGSIVIAPGTIVGVAGVAGRNGGGDAGQSSNIGSASGASGAGRGATAVAAPGNNGGNAAIASHGLLCVGGIGSAVSASPGVDANPGGNAATNIPIGVSGGGGGSGAYNPGGKGGKGGDGYRAGSGGGGGASDNGFDSGAAGKSGDGYVLIEFTF